MRSLEWVTERLDRGDADEVTSSSWPTPRPPALLFGAAPDDAAAERLRASDHEAAVVGRVTAGTGRLRLTPLA